MGFLGVFFDIVFKPVNLILMDAYLYSSKDPTAVNNFFQLMKNILIITTNERKCTADTWLMRTH